MGYLEEICKDWTNGELKAARKNAKQKIATNDGRLTTDSSASLDYAMDRLEALEAVMLERGLIDKVSE